MKTARAIRFLGIPLLVLAVAGLTGCDDNDTVFFVDDDPPAVPTGVFTVTGDGFVEVYWNPVWQDDVAGYGVYRGSTLDGAYTRIATVEGRASDVYVDTNVTNGFTYFYAVDAFDLEGHESDLSFEDAFDTPRPAGTNVIVQALEENAASSAIDFSRYDTSGFVRPFSDPFADLYMHRMDGILYARGTVVQTVPNDLQDLGYTESMDEVSWAPPEGWSESPIGVELIVGHTYVVWTWDLFFAKFRVTEILRDGFGDPTAARIDWAYQIDRENPELAPYFDPARKRARVAPPAS